MSLTAASRISGILALLALMASPIGAARGRGKATPMEVWSVGDDALTVKFRDELEKKFMSSPDFQLSSGNKPGTLVVTIPTNLGWKQVGKRTRVLYKAEFTSANDRRLGHIKGECWQDTLMVCAAQIVNRAKIIAHKVH